MNLQLIRDVFTPEYTLGKLFADDDFLGYTCEDTDRHLETGGVKFYGKTAIPRGKYRVITSYSQHFGRTLPEVLRVTQFDGIRIHGGNTANDSLGCVLLGSERTPNGVRNCKEINEHLIDLISHFESIGEDVWITVE